MSQYGPPPEPGDQSGRDPHNPYGSSAPDPYGQGAPGGHANPAYGTHPHQQPWGVGGPGAPVSYAHWGKRVGSCLIDMLLGALAGLPIWIGYGIVIGTAEIETDPATGMTTVEGGGSPAGTILILIGLLTAVAFFVWNICLKQGGTGYSVGKGVLGIRLVKEQTGQPIGAGMAFLRYLCHILDSLPCYLGYLWPLWDSKRQTFADKVVGTVVVDQPTG